MSKTNKDEHLYFSVCLFLGNIMEFCFNLTAKLYVILP